MAKFSKESALHKQEVARTSEEAIANFESSCNLCNKQGVCVERFCDIWKAHQIKLILLEAEALAKDKPAHEFEIHTKHHSPETLRKMRALRLATRLYNKAKDKKMSEEVLLLLDEISIQLELEQYEYVLILLDTPKTQKMRTAFERIIKGGDEQ